jgi:hypothetical protein
LWSRGGDDAVSFVAPSLSDAQTTFLHNLAEATKPRLNNFIGAKKDGRRPYSCNVTVMSRNRGLAASFPPPSSSGLQRSLPISEYLQGIVYNSDSRSRNDPFKCVTNTRDGLIISRSGLSRLHFRSFPISVFHLYDTYTISPLATMSTSCCWKKS